MTTLRHISLRLSPLLKFRVHGTSMHPTFTPGDVVLVCPWMKNLREGDVIALFEPGTERIIVKRISKKHDKLFFVVGDNKSGSTDSRTFGMIEKGLIIGRVIHKFR